MTRMLRAGLLALLLPFAHCGGDDGPAADTVTADTTVADTHVVDTTQVDTVPVDTQAEDTDVGPLDHLIRVSSSSISGRKGKVLVVLGPENGSRLCAPIGSDPFTLPAMPLTDLPVDGNPCGAATDATRFVDGTYTVHASIFTPGSQTPEVTRSATAEVAGADVTVQLDGAALSSGTSTGSPGRILVATSTPITGRQGKVLLVGAPGARLCAAIDADPWSLAATAMTERPEGNDPCAGETADVVFDGGEVQVSAALYTPGETTPITSSTADVTVDGDITLQLDGGVLSAD
ncbi:MAG: hypothetical protein EP329_05385 [Deltaproteobacteria bacterium]|nr:MAG: hypothetical protein EP329_05385 [Deltaproteobacteria bacterium]